jgi:hypothetical protein
MNVPLNKYSCHYQPFFSFQLPTSFALSMKPNSISELVSLNGRSEKNTRSDGHPLGLQELLLLMEDSCECRRLRFWEERQRLRLAQRRHGDSRSHRRTISLDPCGVLAKSISCDDFKDNVRVMYCINTQQLNPRFPRIVDKMAKTIGLTPALCEIQPDNVGSQNLPILG